MLSLPHYSQFAFSERKTPESSQWAICKEDFGRRLANKKVKKYSTITVWSGWYEATKNDLFQPINGRAQELQEYLNLLCVEYNIKPTFAVREVPGFPGCLWIRVPIEWFQNRITAHLFSTFVRSRLANNTNDFRHFRDSESLMNYLEEVGLKEFNKTMTQICRKNNNRVRGIVEATRYFQDV